MRKTANFILPLIAAWLVIGSETRDAKQQTFRVRIFPSLSACTKAIETIKNMPHESEDWRIIVPPFCTDQEPKGWFSHGNAGT